MPSYAAPAKLNLFLHILGRRPDGYHRLETAFQLLDYGDTITLTPREDSHITLAPDLPGLTTADNLCYRAAHLLQARFGITQGIHIQMDKRIPLGAGLGGGSSNAATVLLGLNQLWQLNLDTPTLAELGLSLGADVPVFIHGASSWGEGIGERLTPMAHPPAWFVVVAPQVSVSTQQIFAHPKLTRDTPQGTMRPISLGHGRNDCQPLVCQLYPQVAEALAWLGQFGPARLTGTGSAVFSWFEKAHEAAQVAAKIPAPWRGFCAPGIEHRDDWSGNTRTKNDS